MTADQGKTPTPRTDALANRKPNDVGWTDYVKQMTDHARALETELSAALVRAERAEKSQEALRAKYNAAATELRRIKGWQA